MNDRNLDAERTVLGAILVEPETFHTAADALRPPDFSAPAHRVIFQAMAALVEKGAPIDLVTLKTELETRGKLGEAGGAPAIGALLDGVPRITNLGDWCRIVKEKAVLRRLMTVARKTSAEAQAGADPFELADRMVRAALAVSDVGGDKIVEPKDAMKDSYKWLDALSQASGGMMGPPTGLIDLDHMLLGLKPGLMYVVAARPSQGKSALAISIADAVAEAGGVVAMFSLEMTLREVTTRRICSIAGVGQHEIAGKGIGAQEAWAKLTAASSMIANRKFFVDDTPRVTLAQIRARARAVRLRAGNRLDLVVVDYLQIMGTESSQRRYESREREVAQISAGLKALAKDLECPVIVCAQLNRGVEDRRSKKPTLADLRESGAIENDADVVILIWRPNANGVQTVGGKKVSDMLIVAKQRNGPTGAVGVRFDPPTATFQNLAVGEEFTDAPDEAPQPAADQPRDYKAAAAGDQES